ncbi:unnamed protein product, partial [Musa textilis]
VNNILQRTSIWYISTASQSLRAIISLKRKKERKKERRERKRRANHQALCFSIS